MGAPDALPVTGAGVMHGGGIVGRTTAPRRLVPAQLFADAVRMHDGGIVGGVEGLGPREVPIIAELGERVSRDGQTGAGGGLNLNIALRIDPELGDSFRRSGRQVAEDLARRIAPILEGR